jgi:uncharacterized membrane protein YozB (DUF420 family)
MNRVEKLDKIYLFYEKHFNNLVVFLIVIGSNLFYWLKQFNIGNGDKVTRYIAESILVPREGILVTVAAVFIGIYFTVFSILGTIKVDSTLAILPKSKFFKLVTFIRNAFLFAFSYLIFTIFYPWLSEKLTGYPKHLLYLFLIILFFYMFLSALKVGLALFVVFRSDLSNLHEKIEIEKKEKEKHNSIFQRLEKFLNEQDQKQSLKKAIDMNEISKRKNPKK